MATTPNYAWTTPDDTNLVKNGASDIRTLANAIDATVKSNADAALSASIIDAKGDLIAGAAADTLARLAVGTNGQVLSADSTASTGLKWVTPAAGGKILQVVQSVYSTEVQTSGDADTGLTASITPSSTSSKVLILVAQSTWVEGWTNGYGGLFLQRNGSTVFNADGNDERAWAGIWAAADAGVGVRLYTYNVINYLDSPSTTSSVTYKTRASAKSGTLGFQTGSASSSMILLEVAG